jgi:SAM-dependent methyltransferase
MDVGAGFGHALWSLRESRRTYELYACEPDPACHGFLRRCGARIFPVALTSQAALSEPLTHAPYDALIVSHVLEHVTRPTSWLAMLSRLLRAGGLMLLEVPHDPMRETRWTRNHAPHVSFFDEESLRECITRSGGTVLFAQTCGPCLPSLQAPWRRAALRAAHLMIPGGLRGRLGRAIDRRRVRSSGTTSAIPLPEFGQYGGPERMFLRAVVTFHTPERSSQVLAT